MYTTVFTFIISPKSRYPHL